MAVTDTQQTNETTTHSLPQGKIQKLLPASTTPPGGSRGGLIRKVLLSLILLLVAGFIYWKITSNNKEKVDTETKAVAAASRPIPVTVAPVQNRTMPIYLTALGTVTAYNTVTIKSRVDGQLMSVNVREGQAVRKGQLIASIDPRPYLAAQAQAEGQLAKDTASADLSKAEAGRYTALYQAGVVSKESQQTQLANAGASAGTLAADRAQIQAAKVNVAYTKITSPIDGVVGLRQVDAGNIVHASDANGLIVVTQLQPITVVFTLPEDQLPQVLKLVRGGSKLVVEAFDRSETMHLASGTLVTVDNQIDSTTGTVKVKAIFTNKDAALFPNQFVNVRLVLEQRQNSLVVPASAIQTGTQGTFVYIARPCPQSGCPSAEDVPTGAAGPKKPGKGKGAGAKQAGAAGEAGANSAAGAGAAAGGGQDQAKGPQYFVDVAPVEVDLTEGSQVILKGGVKPGDQVVIDGQEKLKRNSKVLPKQGISNAGGPGTQAIGAPTGASGSSSAPSLPSSPDQGTPDPAAAGTKKPSRGKKAGGPQ